MRRTHSITLTIVAAMGIAARAQPAADPCAAASFNQKGCRRAVRNGGYCSNGTWLAVTYSNPYPHYYDAYRDFVSGGGIVVPAGLERCGDGTRFFAAHGAGTSRGGFGATGACHGAGA